MSSYRPHERPARYKLLGAVLATTAALCQVGPNVAAQPYPMAAAVQDVAADTSGYGGQLALPIGGSRILRFTRPIGQVMVGNPKVGDVVPLGERTLYVLGKAQGGTSLTVMPRGGGAALATLDLRVGYDVDGIRRAIREVLPGQPLEVAAHGDGVVLTGMLSSSADAGRAASLAEQYAPGHVVNLTSVRGAEQVMISVRVSEVQRSVLQQLGLNNLSALWDTTGTLALAPPVLNPDAVANLVGKATSGDWTFQSLFDALERHGFASTLAEPNLVALSGETAVFFAGGEYPIPVPQSGAGLTNVITIEYKQYGVSIGFTPTVHGDSINLAVAPEVSALDPDNSIILQGYRVPALTTRRAKTTVELRNGQSFAIAGLIRREFTDNLRGIPGASRAPVLGALFRSTGYQNNETEVVIIVTAHLAKPTDGKNLLTPTDVRQGPSEMDLLFNGATDKPLTPARPAVSLAVPSSAAPSGPASPASVAATAGSSPAAAPARKAVAAAQDAAPIIATPASDHVATATLPASAPVQIAPSTPSIARAAEARPVAMAPHAAVAAAQAVATVVAVPPTPLSARNATASPVATVPTTAPSIAKATTVAVPQTTAALRPVNAPAPPPVSAVPRTAPAQVAVANPAAQPAATAVARKEHPTAATPPASARAALPWSSAAVQPPEAPRPMVSPAPMIHASATAQVQPIAADPKPATSSTAQVRPAAVQRPEATATLVTVDAATTKPATDKLLVADVRKPAVAQASDTPVASAGGR